MPTIKINKSQWDYIGKQAGWMVKAADDPKPGTVRILFRVNPKTGERLVTIMRPPEEGCHSAVNAIVPEEGEIIENEAGEYDHLVEKEKKTEVEKKPDFNINLANRHYRFRI